MKPPLRSNSAGPLTHAVPPSAARSEPDSASDHSRLRPSGGYRDLRSFQASTVVYDATVSFCKRFLDPRSRTIDQMVQAARSGRQNIAEGSRASATSSQTELRLVNVARGSLDELLLDYEDFLRQHGHRQWGKDDPEALAVRAVGAAMPRDPSHSSDSTDHLAADASAAAVRYARWLQHGDPAIVANAVICLIHQTNYLLDQQIRALERSFIAEGGYSEQLAAARLAARRRQDRPTSAAAGPVPVSPAPVPTASPAAPACRLCGKPMVLRTAHRGPRAGRQFWGCSGYPQCKATHPLG